MKTNRNMNDAQMIASWAKVTDPVEALEELHEHGYFLGNDPYYVDLDGALREMIGRVLKSSKAQPWPEYETKLGEAGDQYIRSVAYKNQHTLPALFRWQKLWEVLNKEARK